MFNNKEAMRKLPCIVLKRCSGAGQVATSIANQGRTTDQVVSELQMTVVQTIDLEGVTGSIPGNRTDIDELLARKKEHNDFKVVVIQDATRFTRSGQGHGQSLLFDLRSAGLLVYFVVEDLLVDSEMAATYAGFLFAAARHAVEMLAYNTVNGSTASYLNGRSPYCKRPPFGLDRMYANDGVDLHIIRNLPDGTQEQMHPKTLAVMRRFGRNTGKGIPQHYIKQKTETIRLVLGDPRFIAVVHLMFRQWLVDGSNFREIACSLNDKGVPSPNGKEWHTASVRDVLLNPIYIGLAIRNRTTRSIYFDATNGAPKPSSVTLEEIANNNRVKVRMRPRSEWMEQKHPHLEKFLPEEYRSLAKQKIEAYLDSIAEAKPKKPNRDRHRHSTFWLKNFLVSKQGGHPMTGRVGGKNGDVRTFGVSRGISVPKTNNVLRHRVPAAPLESAVKEMIRLVLVNRPGIEDAIKRIVAQEMGQKKEDGQSLGRLSKERDRKQKQLVMLSDDVSMEEDDALSRKVATVKAEIRSLDQRIAAAKEQRPDTPLDVGAVAAKLAKKFEDFGRQIDQADVPHLERIAGILLNKKIEADLETKEVEVEFSLPSWLGQVLSRHGQVGLDELSAYRRFMEAHPENRLILGVFHCDGQGRPLCFTCRRMKRAA